MWKNIEGQKGSKIKGFPVDIVSLRERKQNVLTQAATRKDEIARIKDMMRFIDEQTGEVEYDDALVRKLIERATVNDDRITVQFKSGLAIDVDA